MLVCSCLILLKLTGYGMTEACPGVLHPPLGHVVLGSVGIPLPNTEVKVVHDPQ